MRKKKLGHKPPVWVSQNFLTSHLTIEKLLKRTTINKDDHVIEIGPGKGHTTKLLLKTCNQVSAVEIDEKLYIRLKDKFYDVTHFKLYRQDFMTWPLPAVGSYKVFANIPFCCTSAIIKKLTEARNAPTEIWLTIEKGAAKRFMGKPYETLHSLMIKPLFDIDIAYYFSREDFHPKPGVDVVMLHLKRKPQSDILAGQWRLYREFVYQGSRYGWAGLYSFLTKKQLSMAAKEAGVRLESEEIRYMQWLCLFRCCYVHMRSNGTVGQRRHVNFLDNA